MINTEGMSYEDFKKYCNDRACDGSWSMIESMSCINIINDIDSIKIKGFFKKKKTLQAREAEWKRRNYKTIK